MVVKKVKTSPKARSRRGHEGNNLSDIDEVNTKQSKKSKKNATVEGFYEQYKTFISIAAVIALISILIYFTRIEDNTGSVYDFTVKNYMGNDVDLSIFRGQPIVIVNIATKCGHTENNFEILNYVSKLRMNGTFVRILAFPNNQFGNQEPGTNADVYKYCASKGVKFDIFDKVNVIGKKAHPLFKMLNEFKEIKWNFFKYIIDRDGYPVHAFSSEADFYKISSALQQYYNLDDTE